MHWGSGMFFLGGRTEGRHMKGVAVRFRRYQERHFVTYSSCFWLKSWSMVWTLLCGIAMFSKLGEKLEKWVEAATMALAAS